MLVYCKELAGMVKHYAATAMHDLTATLAIVKVGSDPASAAYVKGKVKDCAECGINCIVKELPEDVTEVELLDCVRDLNADISVTSIIVQLPLPKHIDTYRVINTIDPAKDADCMTSTNVGLLHTGHSSIRPCTPAGIMCILWHFVDDLAGKHCVIVGRSDIVGKPLAAMLLAKDATVTVCHSKTVGLADITRTADILIVATGKPGLITPDMVADGAFVIDVGINRTPDGKLCGDVDPAVANKASVTAVPGGVGLMTRAALMTNVMKGAKRK